jgi:hypothetical protein
MKKIFGGISLGVGIIMGAYAMTMNVGVEVDKTLADKLTQNDPLIVANNDMMNKRLCYLIIAATCCISGVVLLAIPGIQTKKTEQERLMLSQLNLLGSIAGKLDVPVDEINEVMQPYGVVFEE